MEIHRRNAAKQLHLTMVGRILIKGHEDFFPTCAGIDDGIMAESFVVRQSKTILARSCEAVSTPFVCPPDVMLTTCRVNLVNFQFQHGGSFYGSYRSPLIIAHAVIARRDLIKSERLLFRFA